MKYQRDPYLLGFIEIKRKLALETGNYHIDTYTRKQLIPGGKWDFDHIISAKEFSELQGVCNLALDVQSKILNDRKNIGFTESRINKSKSKRNLIEWLESKSNSRLISNFEYYGIDLEASKALREFVLNYLKDRIEKELLLSGKINN